MPNSLEVYHWVDGDQVPCPDWVSHLILDRTLRKDGDGDWFFTNDRNRDRTRINPGDVLISDEKGTVGIMAGELYATLMRKPGGVPEGMHPFVDANGPEPHNQWLTPGKAAGASDGPPYSSTVLARSASAREAQAKWEAAQTKPNPDNAAVEGANIDDSGSDDSTGTANPG